MLEQTDRKGPIMRASARKSLGEYKPLIVHKSGRTEVVGQRGHTERWVALTNSGETYRARRGVTFKSREDAVAYAQRHIGRLNELRASQERERHERHARYATQLATR